MLSVDNDWLKITQVGNKLARETYLKPNATVRSYLERRLHPFMTCLKPCILPCIYVYPLEAHCSQPSRTLTPSITLSNYKPSHNKVCDSLKTNETTPDQPPPKSPKTPYKI